MLDAQQPFLLWPIYSLFGDPDEYAVATETGTVWSIKLLRQTAANHLTRNNKELNALNILHSLISSIGERGGKSQGGHAYIFFHHKKEVNWALLSLFLYLYVEYAEALIRYVRVSVYCPLFTWGPCPNSVSL